MKTKPSLFRIDRLLLAALALLASPQVHAQWSISNTDTTTINFSNTVTGVNNGVFNGSGFQASPSAGQLDSDAWASTGMSDGSLAFGGTRTNASTDYTRGSTFSSTGGFYGLTSSGNTWLAIRPTSADWAPGTLTLRAENNIGSSLTGFNLSYDIRVLNDQGRSSSFNFSWSLDDITYTSISALNYTSPTTADATPTWISVGRTNAFSSISLTNTGFIYFRWSSADVGGSGSRDGFGLDNISMYSFTALAAGLNWTGGSGNWDTGFGGVAPTNGSALSFSAAAGAAATNNIASLAVSSIAFSSGAGSFTNSGNAFTISNGIVNNSASQQVFSNAIALGAAQTFDSAAGAMTFAGNVDNGGFRLTVGGASNTVVSGGISGLGDLTKSGAGTATLSGANTFSGSVAVNGGVLALTNGSALADTAAVTLANSAGVVLEVDQNETIGSLAGGGATGGGVTLDVNTLTLSQSGNTTYTGEVTGTGTLVKTGAGTLTLNRTTAIGSSFDLRISQGTVDLNRGSGTAIAGILGSGNSVVLDGGTLSVSASSGANGALTLGSLDVYGDSTLLLNRLGTAASHTTTLTAPLNFSNNGVLNFAYSSLVTGGTTTLAGASNTLFSDGSINITNYTVQINSAITQSGGAYDFTKAGAGTLILAGANTYTGDTVVSGGVLSLSGSGRIADGSLVVVSSGATMNFTNISDTVKGVSGAGTVSLGSATLTTSNAATDTFSGTIAGTGAYTKVGAGTQVLSGAANSYSGTTTVGGGTLQVSTLANSNSNSSIGSGSSVVLTNGGVLDYTGSTVAINRGVALSSGNGGIGVSNAATGLTLSGAITGSSGSGLTKTGIGRLSLSGSSSYNGATAVSAGELNLSGGSIANSAVTVASGASLSGYGSVGTIGGAGAINPGNSPGILTTPQVDPSGGTDFNLEMTGTAPTYNNASNSVNDVIRITGATPFSQALAAGNGVFIYFSGAALFTGSTAVQYQGGFFTDQSASFASSISGATYNYYFANTNGPTTYNGASYYNQAQYESLVLGTNMSITVTTVAQTANFGSGDINGQVMQVQVIPEPSIYALLGLSAAAFGAYRWRRRRRG